MFVAAQFLVQAERFKLPFDSSSQTSLYLWISRKDAEVPKKSFTEEQVVAANRKAASGAILADFCRQTGVTEMTV